MPFLGTYSSASIRGWSAIGSGGSAAIGRLVTASANDPPFVSPLTHNSYYLNPNSALWTPVNFGTSEAYNFCWNGSILLALGGDGPTVQPSITRSYDGGETWHSETIYLELAAFVGAVWINNTFIIISVDNKVFSSTDGVSINNISTLPDFFGPGYRKIPVNVRSNGSIIGVSDGSILGIVDRLGTYVVVSTDYGLTWSQSSIPLQTFGQFDYFNNTFIIVGDNDLAVSSDLQTWTTYLNVSNNFGGRVMRYITWNGSEWVVVVDGGYIYTTSNFVNWQLRTVRLTENMNDPIRRFYYYNTTYYALLSNNTRIIQYFTDLNDTNVDITTIGLDFVNAIIALGSQPSNT